VDFYLGTHKPSWLSVLDVPAFVSRRRLVERRALPRARSPWSLDSGGFSELTLFGDWRTSPAEYVADVRRFREEVGNLRWAAIQDWMCEPFMLAKTGLTVADHQRRTTDNYAELLDRAPELPWTPVLQGWNVGQYLDHADDYERRGLPLRDRVVGLGSVCRRQSSKSGLAIVRHVSVATGLRLHGFGVKTTGLRWMAPFLESADSMAWSYRARRAGQQDGCAHVQCSNCLRFALRWYHEVRALIRKAIQQLGLVPA